MTTIPELIATARAQTEPKARIAALADLIEALPWEDAGEKEHLLKKGGTSFWELYI